jgi:hypothetical protein
MSTLAERLLSIHDALSGLIPVLDCTALVVFKALFDRTRDWADIEAVIEAGAADLTEARAWLERVLGRDDPIVHRLTALAE